MTACPFTFSSLFLHHHHSSEFFPSILHLYSFYTKKKDHTITTATTLIYHSHPPHKQSNKMQLTGLTLLAFLGLSAAAPAADHMNFPVMRRQALSTGVSAPYATGTGISSAPYPTGTVGTGPSVPYPTAGVSCAPNGAVICSKDGSEFGICNFGRVVFQPVAAGTKCVDGEITA